MKALLLTVFAYGMSVSVQAHELPDTTLHSGETLAVATSYSLTSEEVNSTYNYYGQFFDYAGWVNYKLEQKGSKTKDEGTCSVELVTAKTCGQIDHFYKAALAGTMTCNAYAILHAAAYPNGLTARFTGPSSFVDNMDAATGHHDYYDFSQGIAFDCVYPVKEAEPVEAELSKF
ncbi:hypothetical protein [Kangiella shandongensis]|uniref:hypothetical protein n=1 Tax=Kangiella shandongensis TaxID=2763258 RepID=UPI001CC19A83|nr:hypothetical protein [Kangiella shandongensis]